MRYSFKHVTMVFALCIPLLAAGCASSFSPQRPSTYAQPYAQLHVYTGNPMLIEDVNPELELADKGATTGSFYDNPLRLFGYALYPAGVMLEYILTRPAYFVASLDPSVSGYTVEDAILADLQPIRASR